MDTSSLLRLNCFLCICIYILCSIDFSLGVCCKGEKNEDLDWFILYKLPELQDEESGSDLHDGKAYAYLTSENSEKWNLSSISVESPDSMLGQTWKNFDYNNKKENAHLFYNDQAPAGYSGTSNGHLKGIVAFDKESGFWLIHSIPKFGVPEKYEYPKNALSNGQVALCVTYKTKESFSDICNNLLFSHPNIYDSNIGDNMNDFLNEDAKSIFSSKPDFIKKEPFVRKCALKSEAKEEFQSFAKSKKCEKDIYSKIVAPYYETSLIVETWNKGAGGKLDASCETKQYVTDAQSISMKVSNRDEEINFKSTKDHSKWAVSADSSLPVICIGDLNRMESQAKRGGGAVCFKSKPVWKAFKSIINKANECPK